MNKSTPKENQHSSLEWLKSLHQVILSARCRMASTEIAFEEGLNRAGQLLEKTRKNQSSVWWVGNGGSAAICSHLSQDVLNKLDLKSLFMGDAPLMTCMANDFGYEQVYARPLRFFVKKGDLLIAISSSGNSENILSCVKMAKEKGLDVISLSGMKDNNQLYSLETDISFFVESDLYGIVETAHEAILHGIVETLWLNDKHREDPGN